MQSLCSNKLILEKAFLTNYLFSSQSVCSMNMPNSKTVLRAYLFAFLVLFGIGGCHYFYLGRYKKGFIFLFTLGGLLVFQIIDLFRMHKIVENCNNDNYIEHLWKKIVDGIKKIPPKGSSIPSMPDVKLEEVNRLSAVPETKQVKTNSQDLDLDLENLREELNQSLQQHPLNDDNLKE